jgi:hypothetical protein
VDDLSVKAERLRDDLAELKKAIREKYDDKDRQVVSAPLKKTTARLAETWMVEITGTALIKSAVNSSLLADLNVQFQRLLSLSEHASKRRGYDSVISAILKDYTHSIVIPLKQAAGKPSKLQVTLSSQDQSVIKTGEFNKTAFVGHSFAELDRPIVEFVINLLQALGFSVLTGEKPRAGDIPSKVKSRIERQAVFVGIFTRKDKIIRKQEWTTSTWVMDEKAYALGKSKKLILLKETGVGSIGGIQGADYELLPFDRTKLEQMALQILEILDLSLNGFKRLDE